MMLEWLNGKKMYIVAALTFVFGGLTALGFDVPDWIYQLLVAIGIVGVKSALKKTESK